MASKNNSPIFFAGLVIGGLVGASVALLLTPQSGEKTRAQLRNKGAELKGLALKRLQEAGHQAQAQVAVWQEKGQEAFEKGQQRAIEALGYGKERIIETISQGRDNLMRAMGLGQETATESSAAGQPA